MQVRGVLSAYRGADGELLHGLIRGIKQMNIKHRLPATVIALGIAVSIVGSASPKVPDPFAQVATPQSPSVVQSQITVSDDATIAFTRSEIIAIAAPAPIPPEVKDVEPVPVTKQGIAQPVAPAPKTAQAGEKKTIPEQKALVPVAESAHTVSKVVHVGLTGGQRTVDLGRGPVLFPLVGSHPPYVVEHDSAGGWERFGGLRAGMSVTMTGLVGGTYTVGQVINVPNGGGFEEFNQFATMPKVMLQTCIPGTRRMIIVGLY